MALTRMAIKTLQGSSAKNSGPTVEGSFHCYGDILTRKVGYRFKCKGWFSGVGSAEYCWQLNEYYPEIMTPD